MSAKWTKFVTCAILLAAHVVNGGSNSRSDNLSNNNGNTGTSSSATSTNSLNSGSLTGATSNNLNNFLSTSVAEPKAIGNNWYHYGSPYTVVAHQQPLQQIARDSYADSATDLGYGVPAVGGGGGHGGGVGHGGGGVVLGGGGGGYGGGGGIGGGYGGGGGGGYDSAQGATYHYQLYPAATSGGYGGGGGGYHVDDHEEEGFSGGGGGGSGIGLLGLLGLKGLKGLKVVKGLKALGILSPVLFPILLPLLAPLLLILALPLLLLLLPLLLFLPIPVITVPATGRSLTLLKETARMAHSVATSEECVERISCETARFARGFGFDAPWVKGFLEKTAPQNKWIERVSRGVNTAECKKYTCGQITATKKSLKINKV